MAPVFRKNFKNFSEIPRPKGGGRGTHPLPVPREPVTPFIQFFLKTLSKKPPFSEKNEFFPALAQELSIGVIARQIEKWPLVSGKNSKFFDFVYSDWCVTPSVS